MNITHIPTYAEVFSVNGVGPDYSGLQGNVTYTVIVWYRSGEQLKFDNVVPSHRRPTDSTQTLISAARPGDMVFVGYNGNEIKFGIIEGLANPDTCESA